MNHRVRTAQTQGDISFRQLPAWWPQCPEHPHQESTAQMPSLCRRVCDIVRYGISKQSLCCTWRILSIPNQSVDLDTVHIVQLLQSHLDLSLVRLHIYNEYQSVVLLYFLHRTLGIQRVNDDLVGVKARLMRDRLARVLRWPRELEGLRAVEGSRSANFAGTLRVNLIIDISVWPVSWKWRNWHVNVRLRPSARPWQPSSPCHSAWSLIKCLSAFVKACEMWDLGKRHRSGLYPPNFRGYLEDRIGIRIFLLFVQNV